VFSSLELQYRKACAIVKQISMVDLPTRARVPAGGKRLWVSRVARRP
jgi:hypothetical protein